MSSDLVKRLRSALTYKDLGLCPKAADRIEELTTERDKLKAKLAKLTKAEEALEEAVGFDFQDGNGPVPAHKHPNGGGWVADTALVSRTACVGPNARVYGKAWVSGNARVYGYAQVYGNARVYGNAQVKRGYYTTTPTSITRSDSYTFTLQSDGSIVAECRDFTPEEADAHWGSPDHHKHAESMAIVNALRAIDAARELKGETDE